MVRCQLRGNQVRILNSRAAVYVQFCLISIAGNCEKGGRTLLRESEYLLKAAAIITTRNGKMERWSFFRMLIYLYGNSDVSYDSRNFYF